MAIIIGENSWTSLDEAVTYLTYRVNTKDWFTLVESPVDPGDPSQETYLRMAYNILLSNGSYFLSASLTDENVKKAQTELAFYFVNNYDSFVEQSNLLSKGVTSFSLSKWKETYGKVDWFNSFPLPAQVSVYLNDYRTDNCLVDLEVD